VNARIALRLGRVSNLPTVWTNVLTGLVLAGVAAGPGSVAAALAALSALYVGGMFLNDAFDREIDARERPERPIPSGQVGAGAVFAWGLGLLAIGVALAAAAAAAGVNGSPWRTAAAAVGLAGAIVLYDAWHKGNPASPLLMGLCRMLVYVTAGFVAASTLPPDLYAAAAVLLCYLIGLTYAAKQENLARFQGAWPLAFLAVPFVYLAPAALGSPAVAVLWAGLALWVVHALGFLLRPAALDVPRAVVSLIAGICLVDALFLADAGQIGLAGVAVACFALTLGLQRHVPGT
jgi:4-hydroxybenzoate polyprenyltransferase